MCVRDIGTSPPIPTDAVRVVDLRPHFPAVPNSGAAKNKKLTRESNKPACHAITRLASHAPPAHMRVSEVLFKYTRTEKRAPGTETAVKVANAKSKPKSQRQHTS